MRSAIDRYFNEVLSNENPDAADELLTADVVCRVPTGQTTHGVQAVKDAVAGAAVAFPHRGVQIDEATLLPDRAAIVYTLVMAHVGDFLGVAATGKEITITGIDIFHFVDGKISEIDVFYDPQLIFDQLGIDPDTL